MPGDSEAIKNQESAFVKEKSPSLPTIQDKILNKKSINTEEVTELYALPLGSWSPETRENSELLEDCMGQGTYAPLFSYYHFRLSIENYLSAKGSEETFTAVSEALSSFLEAQPAETDKPPMQSKAHGTYIRRMSVDLICGILQLEDDRLSKLILKHFPIPPVGLFKGKIPDLVQKHEASKDETLKMYTPKDEKTIIKLQRKFRNPKRISQEKERIAHRDIRYLKRSKMKPQDVIANANTPYRPKCDPALYPGLAERIMNAASKVSTFSTIKHITRAGALTSILDTGFYGQYTSNELYLNLNKGITQNCDLWNGDANSICFGMQEISSYVQGNIVIELDLKKLADTHPPAYFKQTDFEFLKKKTRELKLNAKESLFFDHTGAWPVRDYTCMDFQILNSSGYPVMTSSCPKSSLISYNLEEIHKILTLNFFRFMDGLGKEASQKTYVKNFYSKLALMDDEELDEFIEEVERNITDFAELDIFGAHLIDFSTMVSISEREKNYNLNVSDFIEALNAGYLDDLRLALTIIPELFKSYRFLDYLISQASSETAKNYLIALRLQCTSPAWHTHHYELPEDFKPDWALPASPKFYPKPDKIKVPAKPSRLKTKTELPSKDKTEELQSKEQAAELQPKAQATELQPKGQTTELQPKDQTTELQPKAQATEPEPSKYSPEDAPKSHQADLQSEEPSPLAEPKDSDVPLNYPSVQSVFQIHKQNFEQILGEIKIFADYLNASENKRVKAYSAFVAQLESDFRAAGDKFFLVTSSSDPMQIDKAFKIFKTDCHELSKKAESEFKSSPFWFEVKSFCMKLLGIVFAIAATLISAGIFAITLAVNNDLRNKYVNTFFHSNYEEIKEIEQEWSKHSPKTKLFDEEESDKGLINDIEQTIKKSSTEFYL